MRYEIVKCDFPDCDREIKDTYPCHPEFDNWGYISTIGDVCSHHNYSKYLERPKRSPLLEGVASIYEPVVKEQLRAGQVFQTYSNKK